MSLGFAIVAGVGDVLSVDGKISGEACYMKCCALCVLCVFPHPGYSRSITGQHCSVHIFRIRAETMRVFHFFYLVFHRTSSN